MANQFTTICSSYNFMHFCLFNAHRGGGGVFVLRLQYVLFKFLITHLTHTQHVIINFYPCMICCSSECCSFRISSSMNFLCKSQDSQKTKIFQEVNINLLLLAFIIRSCQWVTELKHHPTTHYKSGSRGQLV